MKYFILDYSLKKEIVGTDYPQVYKFIKEYNPEATNALFSLYKYKQQFPDYVPNLDGIMLAGYARITDFVSNGFSSRFFIMSENAKQVLSQYNLCNHQFYSLGLYKRNKKYNYNLLSIISDYSDKVDYEKSCFGIFEIASGKKYQTIDIKSKDEYLIIDSMLKKERGISWSVWSEKIVMKNSFRNLDFFEIAKFDSNTYISKRLKDAIESNGLTGWEFSPATNLVIE